MRTSYDHNPIMHKSSFSGEPDDNVHYPIPQFDPVRYLAVTNYLIVIIGQFVFEFSMHIPALQRLILNYFSSSATIRP